MHVGKKTAAPNVWRIKQNGVARRIIKLMHEVDKEDSCKAMNRMAMLDHLRRGRRPIENDAIRIKVLKRNEALIKGACMRLVKMGQLVAKQQGKTRMYALPKNEAYL